MKTWCKHITHYSYPIDGSRRQGWTIGPWVVPKSWKVCPICKAERPTRENVRAAALRFAMDNDQ